MKTMYIYRYVTFHVPSHVNITASQGQGTVQTFFLITKHSQKTENINCLMTKKKNASQLFPIDTFQSYYPLKCYLAVIADVRLDKMYTCCFHKTKVGQKMK